MKPEEDMRLRLADEEFFARLCSFEAGRVTDGQAGAAEVDPRLAARTMLRPLEAELSRSGHPHPRFGAHLAVLRWSVGGAEPAARLLGLAPEKLLLLESGDLGPAGLSPDAAAAVSRALGTTDEWHFDRAGPAPSPARSRTRRIAGPALSTALATGSATLAVLGLLRLRGIQPLPYDARSASLWELAALMAATGALIAYAERRRPGEAGLAAVVAQLLGESILRLPVPPSAVGVLDPGLHGGGVPTVVVKALGLRWAADVEMRRRDATLRLGFWLALTGIGVSTVGFLALSLRLPWAEAEIAFGAATCVVGYYLGAIRERLEENALAGQRAHHPARWHRGFLVATLVVLAVLAGITSWRFRPPLPGGPAVVAARSGMAIGALLATVACGIMVYALTRFHNRPIPRAAVGRARRNSIRVRFTMQSSRVTGVACLVYAASRVTAAAFIAPTVSMQCTLILTSCLLCLTARECFHDPCAYVRPMLYWFEGRLRTGALGVQAIEEGISMRRWMLESDPMVRPDLAARLHLLAVRLGELGLRQSDSLAAAKEAVEIRRDLAEGDPAVESHLAASLHLLAANLRGLDRREDALAAVEEAIVIRRRLTTIDPVHGTDLAASIYLSTVLRRRPARCRRHWPDPDRSQCCRLTRKPRSRSSIGRAATPGAWTGRYCLGRVPSHGVPFRRSRA